ncbi:unnamed protein product [Schistosoma margrebowiei]|uniref:DRBM domain-containing protein n=1 Tax=Schistosoma margrebowiei TaxID=48269 RepID=A0A3P7XDD7_9TREM|nr:unnamed protein product [Schistosoma margrebowiei]
MNAYFEREGIDPIPQYEFVEAPFGKQHCRIELPLSSGTVTAEALVSGKRKEAVVACALEACQLLDRLGEFDPDKDRSTASKYTRSRAYWEDRDYYSSDEDTYVDRTGAVERKRLNRMRQLGVNDNDEIKTTDELLNNDNAKIHLKNEKRISQNANMITMLSELEKIGEEIVSIEEELEAINKGIVKDAIEHCVLLPEEEGYTKAVSILQKQFGRQHDIVEAFLTELLNGSSISQDDVAGLQNLTRLMTSCKVALSQIGRNADLNCSTNIKRIVKRLSRTTQFKWTEAADNILRRGLEPNFDDLSQFLEKKVSIATNTYGQLASGSYKSQTTSNSRSVSIGAKVHTLSSKGKVHCLICSDAHEVASCLQLLAFSPKEANPSQLDELEAYMNALKTNSSKCAQRSKLKARLISLRQTELQLFHRAGLSRVGKTVKQLSNKQNNNSEYISSSDAAAAVRAARQKLKNDAGEQQSENDQLNAVTSEQKIKNIRADRNALKRSLQNHARTLYVSQKKIEIDRPFEVENDDDEDDDTNVNDIGDKEETQQMEMSINNEENKVDTAISIPQYKSSNCPDSSCQSTSPLISTTATMNIVHNNDNPIDDSSTDISNEQSVEENSTEIKSYVDKNQQPSKVLGPTLPPSQSQKPHQKVNKRTKNYPENDSDDYVEWFPPSDQSGDGITSLNAKYGY